MYIANNWRMVLILLNLEKIVDGGTSNNLTTIIICYLDIFGGMLKIDLGYKVVSFGVDGVIVFQGLKTNVCV
jgi:hypothetical protein